MVNLTHKVLNLILSDKEARYSIREIAIKLNTDYKNIHKIVHKENNSLLIKKESNIKFVEFSPKLTKEILSVEYQRLENLNLTILKKDVNRIETPFFIAILFGSFSKHENTKTSDIDLCIIHNNNENQILSKLQLNPKIEIHEFSIKEFLESMQNKKRNVVHEIIKTGIVLYNIEGYYKLLENGYKES